MKRRRLQRVTHLNGNNGVGANNYRRRKHKIASELRPDGLPTKTMSGKERTTDGRAVLGGTKGNKGPLRKAEVKVFKSALERALLKANIEYGTEWGAVVDSAIKQAKAGNVNAISLLFDRIMGKVPNALDIKQTVKSANININREMTAAEAAEAFQAMMRGEEE